jgi:hypothetical protein
MDIEVRIIRGPRTASVTKEEAQAQLVQHPQFPKGASVELDAVNGQWVAAIATPKIEKESAPPPFAPPSDDEASGPPSDEAPSDDAPSDDGPPKDEGEDKPKSEEKGKGGVEHQVVQILDMLNKITEALGLTDPSSMIPGDEAGPTGPPGGPPIPPVPGDAPGGDGKTHTVHERALKPGEAPPGTTPVGAPSFASVQVPEDHPWTSQLRAGSKFWTVEDEIGDEPISAIARELAGLATPVGCKIEELHAHEVNGRRVASAKIVRVK